VHPSALVAKYSSGRDRFSGVATFPAFDEVKVGDQRPTDGARLDVRLIDERRR